MTLSRKSDDGNTPRAPITNSLETLTERELVERGAVEGPNGKWWMP